MFVVGLVREEVAVVGWNFFFFYAKGTLQQKTQVDYPFLLKEYTKMKHK